MVLDVLKIAEYQLSGNSLTCSRTIHFPLPPPQLARSGLLSHIACVSSTFSSLPFHSQDSFGQGLPAVLVPSSMKSESSLSRACSSCRPYLPTPWVSPLALYPNTLSSPKAPFGIREGPSIGVPVRQHAPGSSCDLRLRLHQGRPYNSGLASPHPQGPAAGCRNHAEGSEGASVQTAEYPW